MFEALEQITQKRQFNGVTDGLHRLRLAADGGPRQLGDRFERALNAFAHADDFQGDALIDVEPHFHAGLEFFLGEQGGTEQHERHQAGFLADAQPAVGKQFVNAHDGAVAIEAEALHNGEGLVAQHALAELEAVQGNLGVNAAHVIRAADAHMSLVRVHRR